ncbi:hypothetical protein [Streptomyces sp. NBC_01571]|uniref:hypothetical protein n=1 Tax=Streptomyces sp. NBC_01571 TaxID=2975883 RepID=UPI002B1CBF04|nr:hypothetical protein [Streptomyces sp. NBC_01571]
MAPGRGRWDLLVVPPTATEEEAGRLMEGAVGDSLEDSLGDHVPDHVEDRVV